MKFIPKELSKRKTLLNFFLKFFKNLNAFCIMKLPILGGNLAFLEFTMPFGEIELFSG